MVSALWFVVGWFHSGLSLCVLLVAAYGVATKGPENIRRLVGYLGMAFAITAVLLLTAYLTEVLTAAFSESKYEQHQLRYRLSGPHAWSFWMPLILHGVLPLTLFVPRLRRDLIAVTIIAGLCVLPVLVLRCYEHVSMQRAIFGQGDSAPASLQ